MEAPFPASAALSLPGQEALAHALGLDPRDPDDVLEAIELARMDGGNQVLGFAWPIQNDRALDCVYAINDLYRAGKFDVERARRLDPQAAEWRLLFQLDSDESAGMMWGDAGMLYIMIRGADLRDGRWERAWMSFQCS